MSSNFYPLAITAITGVCALGLGREAIGHALQTGRCALVPNSFSDTQDLLTYIGQVEGLDALPLPSSLAAFDCRNHRLAWLGLQQDDLLPAVARCVARVGRARVGVFLGTSTSGMLDTEHLFRQGKTQALDTHRYQHRHRLGALAQFVAQALQLAGPTQVVSTACSSSAKVFATAARFIAAGLCDAAVVGGVDSLCYSTLYGFASLEVLSTQAARPFGAERDGISIGEAAAFALLEPRQPAALSLLGVGESSDGHHMSTPHPQGLGARLAMQAALQSAALEPEQIDYLNLHGTGTPANDSVEALAVSHVFSTSLAASSTKGASGHCLGAAGALEALLCERALAMQWVPANVGTTRVDTTLPFKPQLSGGSRRLRYVMSNSFGFGGSNCALVLGAGSC